MDLKETGDGIERKYALHGRGGLVRLDDCQGFEQIQGDTWELMLLWVSNSLYF